MTRHRIRRAARGRGTRTARAGRRVVLRTCGSKADGVDADSHIVLCMIHGDVAVRHRVLVHALGQKERFCLAPRLVPPTWAGRTVRVAVPWRHVEGIRAARAGDHNRAPVIHRERERHQSAAFGDGESAGNGIHAGIAGFIVVAGERLGKAAIIRKGADAAVGFRTEGCTLVVSRDVVMVVGIHIVLDLG